MKIVCLSDTHTYHRKAEVPPGDLLIHCGDVSNGPPDQIEDFLNWFEALPHRHKIFIAGNMDRHLERHGSDYRTQLSGGVQYLENEGVSVEGLQIWGSPVIPRFVGAFNKTRGPEIRTFWEKIPNKLDILITHTPPKGILDATSTGVAVGCADLLQIVQERKPRLHLFGHVHESYGRFESRHTLFINTSFVRGDFRQYNNPVVVELS